MASSSPVELSLRRSIDDLSALDVQRLRRAFGAAMSATGDGSFAHWAGIYGLPAPIQAALTDPEKGLSLSFLPWNRAYLTGFERALQVFEPGIALPWWNWVTDEGGSPHIPPAFSRETADGKPNPLFAAEIPAGAVGGGLEGKRSARTWRKAGAAGPLPSGKEVSMVLGFGDFATFSRELQSLHNRVHNWVGGTNGEVERTAYDPFFWAYQTTIDRIWWIWQLHNPVSPLPQSVAAQSLAPFGVTADDVRDIKRLGYDYAKPGRRSLEFEVGATSDRPAEADQLRFVDYAHAFTEVIASPQTAPPLTIGIYGSWGAGKSSLLEMIAREFRRPPEGRRRFWRRRPGARPEVPSDDARVAVHLVEFNAWEYSSSETIWPSLVRRTMETIESQARWGFWSRFAVTVKRNAARLWTRHRNRVVAALLLAVPVVVLAIWAVDFSPAAIVAVVAAIGLPGLLKLGTEAATNPISRWAGALVDQARYGDEQPQMRAIREDLDLLIGKLGDSRVLVMIDDLDRCEPDKAVEVLQAINLLLGFPAFVICLGIDARVVTAAVEAHYGEVLTEAGASGHEYLDKIVQVPFLIPKASRLEVEGFLAAQMPVPADPEASEEGSSDGVAATAGGSFGPAPGGDAGFERDGDLAAAEGEEEEEEEAADEGPGLAAFDQVEVDAFQRYSEFIRNNPRHIKRLINVYRVVRTLAARRDADEILLNPIATVAWIVACSQWPYTVSVMLRLFDAPAPAADGEDSEDGLLSSLYKRACGVLSLELQHQLDDDVEQLERLLEETTVSEDELRKLKDFTLNFNPAIEKALHDTPWSGRPESEPEPQPAA